jgi:DNA-binding transcriptional LysR family regulator
MHNDNWDDLRYVLAVAEGGSVSAAARTLGVNHATVLRRVASFEERHGVSLFEKGARGYTIPPDRIRVIEAAREAEAAIATVGRLMQGGASPAPGRVRITSTDTFSLTVLPGPRRDRDAGRPAVRASHLERSSRPRAASRRHHGAACAAAARRSRGRPRGRPRLRRLRRAGRHRMDRPARRARRHVAGQWLAEAVPRSAISGSADSFPVLRAMAEAGLGRAVLPCILGDASPVLARLPEGPQGLSVPVWVASHADLADAPRVRTLRGPSPRASRATRTRSCRRQVKRTLPM